MPLEHQQVDSMQWAQDLETNLSSWGIIASCHWIIHHVSETAWNDSARPSQYCSLNSVSSIFCIIPHLQRSIISLLQNWVWTCNAFNLQCHSNIVIDFFLLQGRRSLRLRTAAEAGRWSEQYNASTYVFSRMTHFQGNSYIFTASYFIMRVYLYKIGIGIYMQFVFLQFDYNLKARFTEMQLKINVSVAPFCIFVKWFSIRTLLNF